MIKVGVGVGCTIGILTVEGKEDGVELFVSKKLIEITLIKNSVG